MIGEYLKDGATDKEVERAVRVHEGERRTDVLKDQYIGPIAAKMRRYADWALPGREDASTEHERDAYQPGTSAQGLDDEDIEAVTDSILADD